MKYIYIFLILIIIITVSCEDVIEIELDSIGQKLVVEGVINDDDEKCTVKLTKTGDYFNPSIYPAVSDAVITVTENNTEPVTLTENESGTYIAEDLQGKENTSYSLNIMSEGKEYTANVTIPQKVNIDFLSFMYSSPNPRLEEGYMVKCHFYEPEEFENFYRLKAYKKGDTKKANGNIYIFDDDIISGNNAVIIWNYEVFQPLDTVIVELLTLDKSTYDYLNTLSRIAGEVVGGPQMLTASSTPANPETNLSNDALGYFAAYTVSRDTTVIVINE